MAKQLKKDAQFDAAIIAGFGCGEAFILQEMVPFAFSRHRLTRLLSVHCPAIWT
ncbi:TPA: hypothetical protein ACS727_001303 [Providencia alcalifaciens]|uniref:hypothetical protein n=1 Tax=Providencia alcalifaciens TaxID=126385 RepID=UPI001CC70422